MIIFCTGMVRSGSTWSYNVCRLLLESISPSYVAGYPGEGESVNDYLQQISSESKDFLLKTHFPGMVALQIIQSQQAKNILTYRDPRDSLSSSMQFRGNPFEEEINACLECLKLYDWCNEKNTETLYIEFNNIKNQPLIEIKRIAQYLNFELDDSRFQEICEETSLQNMKRKSTQFKEKVDETTLLHQNHIFGAKIGRWQDELDLEQKVIANIIFKPWLIELNYETEDSFKELMIKLTDKFDITQQAYQYFIRGDYQKSTLFYQEIIEIKPDIKTNYWYLGLSLLLQGKDEAAGEIWISAMLTDNTNEIEQWSKELSCILQEELSKQEILNNYEIASLIRQYIKEIDPEFLDEPVIRLHIGGQEIHPHWKIFDIEDRPEVDCVGNASNLEQFADNSITAIYASHVLEHFYYQLNNELIITLKEWYRVLKPGGKLFISVPDLKTLCWLYLNPKLMPLERRDIMRIIFGGQMNQYDVHKVGFDFDILALYLEEAGFEEYEQVSEFGIFNDCSSLRVLDTLISLNVIATKNKT